MSDSKLEQVAANLRKACGSFLCLIDRGEDGHGHRVHCREDAGQICACKFAAKYAIEAMREPTPTMESAFNRACDEHGQVLGRYGYKVMIDAALK